ncbi:2'-deoxynucleoside 5'-phosphate N-hydrolase 1-like [Talpa occidentalis]|uniref:2'-deoxynucleoside 5'-phosphate N-hydrolase 1-like n=1 Tax=Talpa occidentalis TaxID=50954 RepID=UPI00188EE78E|nr:2'-deoxynucleoside 5'-phosphate N-hydrolase 1-like [Talpa occidentalis]
MRSVKFNAADTFILPHHKEKTEKLKQFLLPEIVAQAAAELGARGEETAGGDRLIHERDLAWLQQADVVAAEVTQPSLGVGYELGRAVALNKQILCLFRPRSGRGLSAMIRGAADGTRLQVWDYEESEVKAVLDRYFEADPPQQLAASPGPTT